MSETAHLPLWQWSATSLAKAIREKRLSSQDVIQAHLDRIEAVNPVVNAVTVVLKKDALRAASEADKTIAAGEEWSALPASSQACLELISLMSAFELRSDTCTSD